MPRRLIKKYLPNSSVIKNYKSLQLFGKILHAQDLWHMHRRNVCRSVAIGLFTAFLPIPFQMVVAAAFAIIFAANLPIAVALVWISNPITIPPLIYFTYRLGTWVLHTPTKLNLNIHSIEEFKLQLAHIWQPLLIGCLIAGSVTATVGYFMMRAFWRYWIIKHWRKRGARK